MAGWLSKNDEIDCETICVICASWSALKLSLALELDNVWFTGTVWVLDCSVFVLRRSLSFCRRVVSTRRPPAQEKLSSRQRFFNSEIDNSPKLLGTTTDG